MQSEPIGQPAAATEDVEVVATAPVDVQTYPHTDYEGRTVYFVNGRSYYSRGSRWYAYRHEPAGLVRQRQYVQQAPPARRNREEAPRPAPEYRSTPHEAVPVQ
ncbi:MAG TPA: hypothetical protein VGL13_06590 [Polyangiaceae bacterium]